jgi:hypothetical protein
MTLSASIRWALVSGVCSLASFGATLEFEFERQIVQLPTIDYFYSVSLTTQPMQLAEFGSYDIVSEGEPSFDVPFDASVYIPRLRAKRIIWSSLNIELQTEDITITTTVVPVQEICEGGPCPFVGHDLRGVLGLFGMGYQLSGPGLPRVGACTWCESYTVTDIYLPEDFESLLDSNRRLHLTGTFSLSFLADLQGETAGFNSKTTTTLQGTIQPRLLVAYWGEYEPAPVPEPSTVIAGAGLFLGAIVRRSIRA